MTQVQQQPPQQPVFNGGQHTFPNASWGGQLNFRQLDGEAEEEEEEEEPSADAERTDVGDLQDGLSDASFRTPASAVKAPDTSNSTYAR